MLILRPGIPKVRAMRQALTRKWRLTNISSLVFQMDLVSLFSDKAMKCLLIASPQRAISAHLTGHFGEQHPRVWSVFYLCVNVALNTICRQSLRRLQWHYPQLYGLVYAVDNPVLILITLPPGSHPNDNDVHFRLSEEQMFTAIFAYVEHLFTKIKPKKVFFMAIDGVAVSTNR